MHFGGLRGRHAGAAGDRAAHGLKVVEDAAHALPTTCGGRLIGTLDSDATVFSFYANKTITTGEGGMLVTRDPQLAQRARTMRLHGMSRDAFDRFTAKVPSWYYEIVAPGFKYNLTDIAAALGMHQLKQAHAFHERRAAIAARYDRGVGRPAARAAAARGRRATCTPGICTSCGWPTPARSTRDAFIERLFAQGIGCSVHYIPLHLQPYWRDRYRPDAGDVPAQPERLRADCSACRSTRA